MIEVFIMFLLESNEASQHFKIYETKNIHDSYSFWVIEASYIPFHCGILQFRIAFRVIKVQRIHPLYYE